MLCTKCNDGMYTGGWVNVMSKTMKLFKDTLALRERAQFKKGCSITINWTDLIYPFISNYWDHSAHRVTFSATENRKKLTNINMLSTYSRDPSGHRSIFRIHTNVRLLLDCSSNSIPPHNICSDSLRTTLNHVSYIRQYMTGQRVAKYQPCPR